MYMTYKLNTRGTGTSQRKSLVFHSGVGIKEKVLSCMYVHPVLVDKNKLKGRKQ